MNRRAFLGRTFSAAVLGAIEGSTARVAFATALAANYRNLLVLIELKGGNDGLNTLVPMPTPRTALRRRSRSRDAVAVAVGRGGLHPAPRAALAAMEGSAACRVKGGVGYPTPNLSHFDRSKFDTASKPDEYLPDGWLSRAFAAEPCRVPSRRMASSSGRTTWAAAGGGTRAVALANTEPVLAAGTARRSGASRATRHWSTSKVEADIVQAAAHLNARYAFKTEFPANGFGTAIRTQAGDRQSRQSPSSG
jgi:uncharacterized protein (DUF1501 family)